MNYFKGTLNSKNKSKVVVVYFSKLLKESMQDPDGGLKNI